MLECWRDNCSAFGFVGLFGFGEGFFLACSDV